MREKVTEGHYSHVLKYAGLFGGVQGLNILIGLVRNKLVVLLLGTNGMGLVSLLTTAVNFMSQSTNLGLSASAVKNLSEHYGSGDQVAMRNYIGVVRSWSILTALLGMVVCVLAGPLMSQSTFSWGNHTMHFVLLAPAVALMALSGGETAILKATRQLRSLAVIQIYNVLAALLISVPLYYFFGQSAIVPVIVLTALAAMLLTVFFTWRLYPPRFSAGWLNSLREGRSMVRLGLAFVGTGVMGSGAEMVIRTYLNVNANLDAVGLYNAGYMVVLTFSAFVFSSMEADYFPRLSAQSSSAEQLNHTVNRQIEVLVLLAVPLLVTLIVFVPVMLPLLYSRDFTPVTSMAQLASLTLFLKALSLPMAYIPLAKGDSWGYLVVEGLFDVALVALVIIGYRCWGLPGTGLALTVAHLFDLAIVYLYVRIRYGYQLTVRVLSYTMMHLPVCLAAIALSRYFHAGDFLYWLLGVVSVLISFALSVKVLRSKTSLWSRLKEKFIAKFHHA